MSPPPPGSGAGEAGGRGRLQAWSRSLGLPGLTEPLPPLEQAVGVALYRALAEGRPVPPERLARVLGTATSEVVDAITDRPGIVLDEAGCVTAYFGLTLKPMPHRILLGGQELFTWCAWDTLLVASITGREAEVSSPCVQTGAPVHLRLGPDGVEVAHPAGARMTMVTPPLDDLAADFHAAFCARIHFVVDDGAAAGWLAANPDGLILGLAEAFAYATDRNRRVYGDAFGRELP